MLCAQHQALQQLPNETAPPAHPTPTHLLHHPAVAAVPQLPAVLPHKCLLLVRLDASRPQPPQHRYSLTRTQGGRGVGVVGRLVLAQAVLDHPARQHGACPALAAATVDQDGVTRLDACLTAACVHMWGLGFRVQGS